MKKVLAAGIVGFVSWFLLSCSPTESTKVVHYPIDSVVHAQALLLNDLKASLNKQAIINQEKEERTVVPADTSAWLREFDIFTELKAINKPIYRGDYRVSKDDQDINSNLHIQSYVSDADVPVAYLKVYYLREPSRIKKIEALYREANSLMKESRLLVMEFQEVYNKTVLTSYSIEGSQKMFLGDSVNFIVKGTVILP